MLLADDDHIPNQEAIALSPTLGWLMLACAVGLAFIFVAHHERWRRYFLRAEDPRAMGVFRIVFGLCVLFNINGLWELFDYLFTDEGLFMTDAARYVRAREQFRGFGNGLGDDPLGFLDAGAVLEWLKGPNYSLLLIWDDPTSFWIQLALFEFATLALIVGWKTDVTKWIAWFFFHSITLRDAVFWEGTENVFRCFFFYLCLSRCGRAYSVDNWLRCRALRRQGRLSELGGPGNGAGLAPGAEHPHGLEPIYRLIPAWPRILVLLQVATIYCYTGVVKNGWVWHKGDALYYALNLDHFWRFPPMAASAVFGTNLFRLNTHVTHYWEAFFPVVVLSLVLRFALRENLPRVRGVARALSFAGAIVFFGCALAIVWIAYPVHYPDNPRGFSLQQVRWSFVVGWLSGLTLVAYGYSRLRYRPFTLTLRGRSFTIDYLKVLRWGLGRRVWLLLGFTFHLHLIMLMNIGWFSPVMLSGYVCFLSGPEIAALGLRLAPLLGRLGLPVKRLVGGRTTPIPPADPTLPGYHRDAARLPEAAMLAVIPLCAVGVILAALEVMAFWIPLVGLTIVLAIAMVIATTRSAGTQLTVDETAGATGSGALSTIRAPWAHGPFGRFVANSVLVYHLVGVACWLLPEKDCLSTFRVKTHDPFRYWLEMTQTTQGWAMFAPNPPRSNVFLKVLVTDKSGETYDMNTDMYHPSQRPIPWVWYTRWRKINRRIGGGEGGGGSWYQKWHARYFCRRWELDHQGERAQKVELVAVSYSIPTPEWVAQNGPYDPMQRLAEFGKQESLHVTKCAEEEDAQAPNRIRERYGLPPVNDVKRWGALFHKQSKWEERKKQAAAN